MSSARLRLTALILAAASLLAACQPLVPGDEPAATSTPAAPTEAAPTPTHIPVDQPVPTATADPAAACPMPGADQALYVSRENGFCFLYPAYFQAQPDGVRPGTAVTLIGPAEIAGMEGIATTLSVAYNGPADGLDSQTYGAKWQANFLYGPGPIIESATVGGQPAVLVRRAPGGLSTQQIALLVAGGVKYQVSVLPEPGDSAKLDEHVRLAWDTVTASLVFFPPVAQPVVRPAEVCPAATADTKLWINETAGFCLLYPADYTLDTEFPGRIIGGPLLADTTDWGQVRTSIFVATYDLPDSALAQALTPPTEQIDPASVQSLTIGGAPAILYDFTGGPWRQRTASLVARGSQYTMVGPWDGQAFPGSEAEAEKLWGTVTSSIAFFDKWR